MSPLTALLDLIRDIFSSPDVNEPPAPRGMQVSSNTGYGLPVIELTIHSSKRLRRRNGHVPELMAATYLARAFDEARKSYEIRWNFDSVPAYDGDIGASLDLWMKSVNGGLPAEETGKDANILLIDSMGGGLSSVSGKAGIAPGRFISTERPWRPVGVSDQDRNIHAILHEVGHMLGLKHDHDRTQEGMQHPGVAWNDHDRQVWHRTPTVAGNGYPNLCGEEIPEREYSSTVRHQTYHRCAVEHFDIKPNEDSVWDRAEQSSDGSARP